MELRNDIAYAVPFFLAAIALELALAARARRRVYRLQDAIANLGCGIAQQVSFVFLAAGVLWVYGAVHAHAPVRFAAGSPWPWIVAFVWVEVAYYWWHRLSHEVNLLWAAHAVHHQSEDYNLAVALRQAILSPLTLFPFYLPMALLGVPTLVYAVTHAYTTLYQFWIHTELVGKLGAAEKVINTPSHHRVHHAVNPRYLDRNYGAVLIVWDRLFGSFAEERERPVYGTTKPLGSYHPLWAQLQPFAEIAAKARRLPRLRDRVLIWFRSPAWTPDGAPGPSEADTQRRTKRELPISRRMRVYAILQFAPVVAVAFLVMLGQSAPYRGVVVLGAVFVFWTLFSVGALLDGRSWARPVEALRVAAAAAVVAGLALHA